MTLFRGVVASLLLTAAPVFAVKAAASTSQTQSSRTQHGTQQALRPASARSRETSPQRHAALHRRGRAYAGNAARQPDPDQDNDIQDMGAAVATDAITENSGGGEVIARGTASWYGVKGNGLRTSSGERFDENAMTAAHSWLPLGTRVRVTVAGTNTSVVVTINDRPGTRSRVIDLSKGAARELGILGRGIATVTLTRL